MHYVTERTLGRMVTDKESLKTYIEEQRRYHAELTSSYLGKTTKIITYIGAILALLAFLYSGALDSTKPTFERLFIPAELYGKIFYAFGLFLLLYALGKLIHAARPAGQWTVAVQSKDVKAVESMTEEAYLLKLKDDYENARRDNIALNDTKHYAIRDSYYPMLIGAIVLIVLRYFQ